MAILARISHSFLGLRKKLWKGGDVSLLDVMDESCVTFVQSQTRDGALEELVAVLKKNQKLESDDASFFSAILQREKIVSTGVGMGVAIPHAKLHYFKEFFLAIGIQKDEKGIPWDSLDGLPVRLIFLIGGPSNHQTEYLTILSKITQMIRDDTVRKQLLSAQNSKEVIEIFDAALYKTSK